MKFKNSLKIANLKLKIRSQSGEIATILTLISVGLMLLGAIAGTKLANTGPKFTPFAQVAPSSSCKTVGSDCTGLNGTWSTCCLDPKQRQSCNAGAGVTLRYLCDGNKWTDQGPECQVSCAPATASTSVPAVSATPPPSGTNQCTGSDKHCVGENDCPYGQEINNSDCSGGTICCKILPTPTIDPSTNANSTPSPTAAPNKQLGAGNYVVCSDTKTDNGSICDSNKDGSRKFCYNECRPDKPGYSQPVYCSGLNGYEADAPQKDPACDISGPAPTAGAECSQKNGQPIPDMQCTHVACDGLNWVQMGFTCFDGHAVEMPGKVLRAGNCGDPIPTCIDGKVAPTAALLNPTKSSNSGGFHLGADIFTINRDNGVEFQFNVKYYSDGCDGDINLFKNGGHIAGTNAWNIKDNPYVYGPGWTQSPIVGNGQVIDVTYSGTVDRCPKSSTTLNDSIRCRLAVDNLGNPRVSGTGCEWKNPGEVKPIVRSTITPGQASSSNSNGSTQSCNPYTCPNDANKKFSVRNGQLYDSSDCSGNTVNFNTVCGANSASGCAFVGGRCENAKSACNKNTDTGNWYSNWGPADGQVSTPLCPAGSNCCEPKNGPEGGFLPKALPTITAPNSVANNTPQVGGDCIYTFDPSQSIKGQDVKVSVNLKNGSSINPASVVNAGLMKGKGGLTSVDRTVTNSQNPPWNFKFNADQDGEWQLNFGWNCGGGQDCGNKCGAVKINVNPGPTATPISSSTPKCSDTIVAANIPSACSSCIKGKIETGGTKLSSITECNNDDQKINIYCKNHTAICGNYIAACSTCNGTAVGLYLQNFQSASNQVFDQVVAEISAGHTNALVGSIFVTAANRAPGLQHEFCDPGLNTAPGGCTFGVPSNSPVGT